MSGFLVVYLYTVLVNLCSIGGFFFGLISVILTVWTVARYLDGGFVTEEDEEKEDEEKEDEGRISPLSVLKSKVYLVSAIICICCQRHNTIRRSIKINYWWWSCV